MKRGLIGAALLVALLGSGVWVLTRSRARVRSGPSASAAHSAEVEAAVGATLSDAGRARPDRRIADQLRARLAALPPEATANAVHSADAATAASGRAISTLAQRQLAPSSEPATAASVNLANASLGHFTRDAVRTQFLPMAGGCYEELLTRSRAARGKIALHVAVGGDPSVGNVVESVDVLPRSTFTDEAFLTCMAESMMSLQFSGAPSNRYHFDFDYDFDLAPDEPDAGR